MSNYNEGARGRARYWMERAQRAEAECKSLRGSLNAAVELHGDCEERCRTLEAECERLREHIRGVLALERSRDGWTVGDVMNKLHAALATPPPEINQVQRGVVHGANGPTWYEKPAQPPDPADTATQAMGQLDEIQRNMDVLHAPEQVCEYSIRCVICYASVRPEDGGLCDEHKYDEQAHGDALAALVDEIAPPIPPFNSEAEEEEYHCEAAVRHYSERVRERLRRHLTASGVPYVPESIKNLPERMRSAAKEMQAQEPKPGSRLSGRIDEAWVWADELEVALASAPAVPDGMRTAWPTRDVLTKLAEAADILLYRYNHDDDGWEMIAHARDVARERAAAPTDGGE